MIAKVDGSTPTLASLLLPWIRRFTIIISAGWNLHLTDSKLKKSKAKLKRKAPKRVFVLYVDLIAPPSLSCDRRIKMKKSSIIITGFLHHTGNQIFDVN